MKIRSPLLFKIGGLLSVAAVRHWMGTLDYKIVHEDPSVDPGSRECTGQKIYVLWHEYLLIPFSLRAHCNIALLLSRHQDAEILSYGAQYMGFDLVRGSTNRGGVTALRELFRKSRDLHLAITPDGPRGPRRQLAVGPIYLASKLQMPIVAMGFGYDRPWRFRRAWDQFAVPKPYSRVRAMTNREIWIPSNLDRDGLEAHRQKVEATLNQLTDSAEAWAESGERRLNELTIERNPVPLR